MQTTLKVGDRVDKVVAVARKVKKEYSGGTFLLFQFSSREGMLRGVMWEPTPEAENDINVRDVVRIKGDVQDYQGALQLKVSWIQKLDGNEYDPTLFLPVSPKQSDKVYTDILEIISSVSDERLRILLQTIFEDEAFMESFLRAPAAKGWHHAYVGGLAEHVNDMLSIALRVADVYPEADRDLLVAGVLLHDLGKLQELSVSNYIEYSDKGRLLGHITLGVEFLDEYLRGLDSFPDELAIELKHMILSHHGSLENGSPVVPMTIEALLLHYLDNMDAQVRGALQAISKTKGSSGSWTEYVKLLDRYMYTGSERERLAGNSEEGDA